jgi:putative DNA primase/helicase
MTEPTEPTRILPTVDELIRLNRDDDVNLTDTGNAKRFVQLFRDIVRYAPETDVWLVWNGTHWEPDVTGKVFGLTAGVVREIRAEAMLLPDEPGEGGGMSPRQRMLQFAFRTESEGSRRKILTVAPEDPAVVVRTEQLNAMPHLIAAPNGTIDLNTGDLIPSAPEHLSTACVRVPYDPLARSRELDRYLTTFMPDEEDQAVLFGVLGTALRGGNSARLMPLFLGPSTSGKSQLMAAVAALLQGYATAINVSVFRGNLDDKPRPDLVRAMHTRIAYASEAAQSWELHADQVKRLTGGDKILYRNLYAQAVEAEPLFTPFIIANEMPRVKGADDAFRRRMIVVRFGKNIIPGFEDIRIRERFVQDRECLQALLTRMVEGARSPLFSHGMNWSLLPERFALAMMDAFDEVDHVGSFLLWMAEQGHLLQGDLDIPVSKCVKAADLHGWYSHWVTKHGDRTDREGKLNLRNFGAALRTRGWESERSAGVRWVGWRLVSEAPWL